MRTQFERQLDIVNTRLMEMGDLLDEQIRGAILSYRNRDSKLAEEIIKADKDVNEREKEIEQLCLRMLLLQQPVAHDLRNVSSALKIITDMERIGDQAADIAEITIDLIADSIDQLDEIIDRMAEMVLEQFLLTRQSFIDESIQHADQAILKDDDVDKLFFELKEAVVDVIQEDSETCSDALDYLMIGKHLEKIGDYTANIARWVKYFVTGKPQHKN